MASSWTSVGDRTCGSDARRFAIDLASITQRRRRSARHRRPCDCQCRSRAPLVALGYEVEAGKSRAARIRRPVLFGPHGTERVAYEVDAVHDELGIVVEIEAGRGAQSNAVHRDLIRASLIVDARFFVLGVMGRYRFLSGGRAVETASYEDAGRSSTPSTPPGDSSSPSRVCCSSATDGRRGASPDLLPLRRRQGSGRTTPADRRPPLPDVPVLCVRDPRPPRHQTAQAPSHGHPPDLLPVRPAPPRRELHPPRQGQLLQRVQGLQPPRLRTAPAGAAARVGQQLHPGRVAGASGKARPVPVLPPPLGGHPVSGRPVVRRHGGWHRADLPGRVEPNENLQPLCFSCNSRKGDRVGG